MKMIKKGKIPPEGIEKTCGHCKCIFEYIQADVKAEDRPCSDPYVICPTCSRPVNIMDNVSYFPKR